MTTLPPAIVAPAPFPAVIAQSMTQSDVTFGVRRATYRLATVDGPLVIDVVAIDTREPTLHLGAVIANDRLVGPGETVSSMAARTHAVAGVNADYFDIGQTNQPLNLVVREGALVRTPSRRVVLDVRADGGVRFERAAFTGTATYGGTTLPLTTVNEWPPQGGAGFLTRDMGAISAAPGVALAQLVPVDPAQPIAHFEGAYTVAAIGSATAQTVRGPLLGFGPAARNLAAPPKVGDVVMVATATTPELADIEAAVGGGPLLLAGGAPAADADEPAPEERDRRFPVTAAGLAPGGELLLASVDGRQPSLSIGVTRPQLAALLQGLGATDAMAFDSGGSATLVARRLGDTDASVLNSPSDGEERRVADGLFAYSDAPFGPATRLAIRPAAIDALPGTLVPVRAFATDDAGHPLGPVRLEGGDAVRAGTASERVRVRGRGLETTVPVHVVTRLARLDVAATPRMPQPGAAVAFTATGFDETGAPVALGDAVRWTADGAPFAVPGALQAGRADVRVVAHAGGRSAELTLRVGSHTERLSLFDPRHAGLWTFATAPAGGSGGLDFPDGTGEMRLRYDLSGTERAAYANAAIALPGEPLAFSVEVDGDGRGEGIRAAFVNRFGERRALTLAASVDFTGIRRLAIALPPDLNPPVRLAALYVVDGLAGNASHAIGSIGFRAPIVTVAGST